MKNALIFGAAGFVGKYLAEELKRYGYCVHGSDVRELSERTDRDIFTSFRVCDLLDSDSVRHMIEALRPTHIINLAAVSSVGLSWKIPQKTMEINVIGGLNILEASREVCPEARLLFIGSSEEYMSMDQPISEETPLDANNPYGVSKLAIERISDIYRRRYGLKVYHVRAFNHTGIGQNDSFVIPSWCRQAAEISKSKSPGMMKVGNIEIIRDFSDVRDIVRAYRMVIESDDCEIVFNIGSGKGTALKDILFYLQILSQQPIAIEQDPQLFRPADNPVIICDHNLISQRLGWQPEHDLMETVKELFLYYSRQGEELV